MSVSVTQTKEALATVDKMGACFTLDSLNGKRVRIFHYSFFTWRRYSTNVSLPVAEVDSFSLVCYSAPRPISNPQLTVTHNSSELFLTSLCFHIQNGAFDLGNMLPSLTLTMLLSISEVNLLPQFLHPNGALTRSKSDEYPFSRKIVSIGRVCLLLRLVTFCGSRPWRTS